VTDPPLEDRRGLRFSEAPRRFVFVSVLLAATFVALLWVPSYAHITPTFEGIPFFYWYSILWLIINAASQFVAYQLLAARRRQVGDDPAGSGGHLG